MEAGSTWYRSRITLDQINLHNTPANFHLIPGMPVTADVLVGKQTVMAYFLVARCRWLRGYAGAVTHPRGRTGFDQSWRYSTCHRSAVRPASAALRRAVRLTDKGDRRAAFPLLARAARAGIAEAEFRVGRCYLEGAGVPPGRANGVRWLEKAATQGYVEAQALLATLCLNGMGPDSGRVRLWRGDAIRWPGTAGPDFETALHWARRAAEGGSAEGQAVLGYILGSGPEAVRDQAASRRMVQALGRSGMPARPTWLLAGAGARRQ